ncbi:MAG: single-stranded-DNA-specific exonuclease RecJ [Lachnospiraceae bacterium]|nr:single-stranded-DNA-specific exonuclease RecJ [Lachnospiraceae bacterium]
MKQTWVIRNKKGDVKAVAKEQNISEITAKILINRDLASKEERDVFLHPSVCSLKDPSCLLNAVKAAEALKRMIADNKKIRIIGDYDVDGITSTYVLYKALSDMGAVVDYRIPHRMEDGYGVNISMVEDCIKDGVEVLLTCDNGISEFETIKYAKENGMFVIITDHHDIPREELDDGQIVQKMPEADIIVNPKQPGETSSFTGYCGCVVAMKVIEACGVDIMPYLPYAAMATLCDVMEVRDENRVIVTLGLSELRKTRDVGLSALIEKSALNRENISAYHIGFVIGPCLNASGRLDTAEKACRLLLETDMNIALKLAGELTELNKERKEMTEEGAARAAFIIDYVAKARAEAEGVNPEGDLDRYIDKVIVVNLQDCHESIAGIVAGRIREKYNRPAFVFTQSGDILKASGRSIDNYSMYDELYKVKDILLRFGGHPMAAGLSIAPENFEEFQDRINEVCTLTEADLVKKIKIDAKIPFQNISFDLINELSLLEPFGKGNEKYLFADSGLKVAQIRIFGKNSNILKLNLINSDGFKFEGIYFGDIPAVLDELKTEFGEDEVQKAFKGLPNCIFIAATYLPEKNEYNGIISLQAKIQNIKVFR